MRGKAQAKNGEEQDAITGWRHLLCYMGREGVTKSIKQRMNRRERRSTKQHLHILESEPAPSQG